jgi:hypothetical protein
LLRQQHQIPLHVGDNEKKCRLLWRKRRLRLAEAAAFRRGLTKVASPDQQTINAALVHLDVEKHLADDPNISAARWAPAK